MKSMMELLKQRGSLIGIFATLGSDAFEIACLSGLDLAVADGEHGAFDIESFRRLPAIAEAAGCIPIARIPSGGSWMIEAMLDAGFCALITPMVNTPEQARAFVTSCYYPPMGVRSQSTCRASLIDSGKYRHHFNHRFTCLVMIEHIEAVKNIENILAVEGISGCFVGPTDLESSLIGNSGYVLKEEIAKVLAVAKKMGKIVGIAAPHVERAMDLRQQGFDFVIVSTDRKMIRDAVSGIASAWRQESARV